MSYEYNFKIGDKILIKHTNSDTVEAILKGTDRIVEIGKTDGCVFWCKRGDCGFYCQQKDIAGYGFGYNQPIEVSQDGEKWERHYYSCYGEGFSVPYFVFDDGAYIMRWTYARPIQEVKEETPSDRHTIEPPLDSDELKRVRKLLECIMPKCY